MSENKPAEGLFFKVGDTVEFLGDFYAGLHSNPNIKRGFVGEIISVRSKDQVGFDYWLYFPKIGAKYGVYQKEISRVNL